MEKLYSFNRQPENWTIQPVQRHKHNESDVVGGMLRRLLLAVYTVSFLCLLCIDKALRICCQDIEPLSDNSLKLTLWFQKTNPYGSACFPARGAICVEADGTAIRC